MVSGSLILQSMPVFLTECDIYALKKVAIFSLIFAVTISVCGMLIVVTDILQYV